MSKKEKSKIKSDPEGCPFPSEAPSQARIDSLMGGMVKQLRGMKMGGVQVKDCKVVIVVQGKGAAKVLARLKTAAIFLDVR